MSSNCAYCNLDKQKTREHIWPACMIKRTSYDMRYSEAANRVLDQTDLVIKDVCIECNNGPLSQLDAYACNLFDKYFNTFHKADELVDFSFEYGLLRRWLLKVSYNCARASKQDSDIFKPFLDFILLGGEFTENFSIMVEILAAEQTSDGEVVLPKSTRCGRVEFPDKEFPGVTVRMVSINSYCFYLVFQTASFSSMSEAQAMDFIKTIRGKLIYPEDNTTRIRVSAVGASSFHEGLFAAKKTLFEDYLKNKKSNPDKKNDSNSK